jgi:hypothetical protein
MTISSKALAPDSLTHVKPPEELRDQQPADPGFADRELADIPAVEVVSRAAVMLMSAAAEQLGLADENPNRPAHRDLDEARKLITALAGLLQASLPDLGPHAAAFREGLAALQGAFREYSAVPDLPGQGPGEGRPRPS